MKRRLGNLAGLSWAVATLAAPGCRCSSDDNGPPANTTHAGHENGGAGTAGAGGSRAGSGGSAPNAGKGGTAGSGKGGRAMGGTGGRSTAGDSGASGTGAEAGENGAGATSGSGGADEQAGASGAGAGGEGGAVSCGEDATQSRVVLVLDTTNPDWVTDLEWTDSSNASTGNIAAHNGLAQCAGTAPTENFGQAFGAPEGNAPYPAGAGALGTLTTCGLTSTSVHGPVDCNGDPVLPVTTKLQRFGGARDNQIEITRTFGFDATTPVYGGVGLRPYVARLPLGTYSSVIIPNGASTSTTVANAGACSGDCITATGTDWNGRWIADLAPSTGIALIILRDASMTSPVDLTVNNDASSGSNLSSFILVQPSGGWQAPITEIERLCFEDLTTWPQSERDAAVLPSNCSD